MQVRGENPHIPPKPHNSRIYCLNSADIHKDAATTVARAVKEGLDDEIYCRFCGAKIKKGSVFFSYCGKQLK